ncbi:hypothetical protein ACHAXS_000184 [Conticribra weissflogii]
MNVIDGTWAFKCKQYPNGTVRKIEAHFCACWNQHSKGIDFLETSAPNLQWTTTCLMLILENQLGMKSK